MNIIRMAMTVQALDETYADKKEAALWTVTQGALTDLFCKHTSHRDASLSEFYPHKCTPLDIALTFLYGFPLTLHTF